ncbi:hypothetical protein MTsPCn5_31540 [Croceitalea sp. MTPC5]|uniref:helix-turn-helix transcriptional regulator n=1 Tax=Croceitalea sp. MTPC5 TaxID=3056565 RepID=UPI002B38D5FD|nr:hypothetical protein MTsPCn5_31540 [Croceitalea sp. MTPC5]
MHIIKELRRKNGINQSDLASAIGVSLRTIQLYEKKDANIPIKNLTKIADFFDSTIAELYLQEVNEEDGIYTHKRVFSTHGNICHVLKNGKFLIEAPLLLADSHDTFLESVTNEKALERPVKCTFLIDYFDDGGYMAFEVIGDSMNDGSVHSIPNNALVLGVKIDKGNIFSDAEMSGFLNKAFVIVGQNRIICKQITGFNAKNQSLTCSSLNDSPEYRDFEIPLVDVVSIFRVVKRQF